MANRRNANKLVTRTQDFKQNMFQPHKPQQHDHDSGQDAWNISTRGIKKTICAMLQAVALMVFLRIMHNQVPEAPTLGLAGCFGVVVAAQILTLHMEF